MKKHFINLTNGIQAIKDYNLTEYSFIRIQSTALEQKRWNFIIQDLDNNFLMNLALGNECIVYDYSQKREVSRAIWQGLTFIEFVLNRFWFGSQTNEYMCRTYNCYTYFNEIYHRELIDRTFKKLEYFKKFLNKNIESVKITSVDGNTDFDGNFEFYKGVLNEFIMQE